MKETLISLLPRTRWKDKDTFVSAPYTQTFAGPLSDLGLRGERVSEFIEAAAGRLSEALDSGSYFTLQVIMPCRLTAALKRGRKLERVGRRWRGHLTELRRAEESEFEVVIYEVKVDRSTQREVEIDSFVMRTYEPSFDPDEDFI